MKLLKNEFVLPFLPAGTNVVKNHCLKVKNWKLESELSFSILFW
jgi:hypothetical protein